MAGLNIGDVLMRVLADMSGFEADVTKKATAAGEGAGKSMGSRMGKAVTVGLTAAGAAAGTVFVGAIGGAANFEDQLRTINTVAHLTDDELKGVGDSILNLSKETGKSTDDLTAGFYDLVSAGVPADKAINVLRDSAEFATGALGSTAEAVDVVTSALNAYGLGAEESTKVTDIFAQAVADGKVTAAELGSSIATIAPIAAQSGVSLEEVSAGFALLTAKGVPAAQAATQMRAAISALLTPNKQLNDIQEETGINFAEMARTQGLVKALDALRTATAGNDDAFAKALGSIEAYNFGVITTGESAEAYATELDKVTVAAEEGGVAHGQYEERMKSAKSQGEKFVAGIRATAIQLAGPFVDSLGGAVIALNELGGGMGGLVNLSRLFGGALGGVAGFVASKLGPLLKSGLAKALGKTVVDVGVQAGEKAAEGLAEGMSQNVGGAVASKGLAGKIASALGVIAVPIAIGLILAQIGQEQIEKQAKPEIERLTEEALTDGTKEGMEKAIKNLQAIAHHNSGPYADFVLGQAAILQRRLDEMNGLVTTATDPLAGQIGTNLKEGRGTVDAAAKEMVSGIPGAVEDAGTAAGTAGAQVPQDIASGIIAKQSVVRDAMSALRQQMSTELTGTQQANRVVGNLVAKDLAQGLKDGRPGVRAAANDVRTSAEEELKKYIAAGHNIGINAQNELAAALKSKDPLIRAQAQRTKRIIEEGVKARTKPVGAKAGSDLVAGLNSQKGPVGTAASNMAKLIAQRAIAAVLVSAATAREGERKGEAGGGPVSPPPRMAGGGTPLPFAYQVNEKGQELFVPAVRGRIMTAADTRKILSTPDGAGGGDTINMNLETYGLPMRAETPMEVASALERVGRLRAVTTRPKLSWRGAR